MDFKRLSEVFFLLENIIMKEIFNPYLSNDDKDILFEMQKMEEIDATISANAKLFKLSANATALCRQVSTATESVQPSC